MILVKEIWMQNQFKVIFLKIQFKSSLLIGQNKKILIHLAIVHQSNLTCIMYKSKKKLKILNLFFMM